MLRKLANFFNEQNVKKNRLKKEALYRARKRQLCLLPINAQEAAQKIRSPELPAIRIL